jgi:hypothetical protein
VTQFILIVIAGIALFNGVFGIGEWLQVSSSSKATVFQELSARINIGLSLLVLAVSVGLFAVVGGLSKLQQEQQRMRRDILDASSRAIQAAPEPAGAERELSIDQLRAKYDRDHTREPSLAKPLVLIGVLAFGGLAYVATQQQWRSTPGAVFPGTLLTWACPDGSTHIRTTSPASGCVGR